MTKHLQADHKIDLTKYVVVLVKAELHLITSWFQKMLLLDEQPQVLTQEHLSLTYPQWYSISAVTL